MAGARIAIGIQPVGAAVEGQARFVVAHLRVQPLDLRGGDIGRVGHHQVEAGGLQAGRPVGSQQRRAAGEAEIGGVLPRHRQRLLGNIDAEADGGGPLRQNREKEGAGADAEIEHLEPRVFLGNSGSTASRRVSLSGRGVSTSGVTRSMIFQKPLTPRMWLIGSRRARRSR